MNLKIDVRKGATYSQRGLQSFSKIGLLNIITPIQHQGRQDASGKSHTNEQYTS